MEITCSKNEVNVSANLNIGKREPKDGVGRTRKAIEETASIVLAYEN